MQQLISSIKMNDVTAPIRAVLAERRRLQKATFSSSSSRRNAIQPLHYSMYRDILFLSFTVLGHDNIDHGKYSHITAACIEASSSSHSQCLNIKTYSQGKLESLCGVLSLILTTCTRHKRSKKTATEMTDHGNDLWAHQYAVVMWSWWTSGGLS